MAEEKGLPMSRLTHASTGLLARFAVALALALGVGAAALAPQAFADDTKPVSVALTVVDATDNNKVVYNDKVRVVSSADNVEGLLSAAGFTRVETWSADGQYVVSNGSPYFLGKAYDPETWNYWQTIFNGTSESYSNALIEITDWETGETSPGPNLQDKGHYQYVYGNGSQEIAPTDPDTWVTTFAYTKDIPDPLVSAVAADAKPLTDGLKARFAKEGKSAALTNGTYAAAPALKALGATIDGDAILANLAKERKADDLTAGRLAKYIIALTAAGKDCTAVFSDGTGPLVSEMEAIMTEANDANVFNAPLILEAYYYGGYDMSKSPLSKDTLINAILTTQDDSGLFGGRYPSAQSTAQAIVALAPYRSEKPEIEAAIQKGLDAIFTLQEADGGFRYDTGEWGTDSDVDTTGEVIVALAALGIDPDGDIAAAAFTGETPVSFLVKNADASNDGFIGLAEKGQLFSEPMGASYALFGLAAASQEIPEAGYYIYDPVKATPDTKPADVTNRIKGSTALDTMSAIVEAGDFAAGGTAILATVENFPDALAANGVAGLAKAPIILTTGASLSDQAKTQFETLKPKKIIVVGGKFAVTDDTANAAAAAAGGATVERLRGSTAIDTANDIYTNGPAKAGGTWNANGAVFLCCAGNFPDALSAAPLSYKLGMPILLTEPAAVSDATIKAMKDGGVKTVYIVGGKFAINESVVTQLTGEGFTVAERLSGKTALDTSVKVAEFGLTQGMSANNLGVATVNNYPDALASGPLTGQKNAVGILVDKEDSVTISGFVAPHSESIYAINIFGGKFAITEETQAALNAAAQGSAK